MAQQEVAGFAKDGGKNVKMPDGKEKNVVPISTAEYGACGWRAWLNGTTITLGMQNVFDSDPPFVGGRLREWLRRIPCRCQRPVLLHPAKEEILANWNRLDPNQVRCAASRASKESSPRWHRHKTNHGFR